ncbi:MAG: triose-phosphate isomerase [bacterium]|nr:triose-phosphate isomerase [bacterium]
MKPLVVANWKMQLGDEDAVATARELAGAPPEHAEVVLCPSFTALAGVAAAITNSSVLLGAQDCAWQERGAFTGGVSPADLRALGCRYVIVGHSERRQHFGETDAMIGVKVRAALGAGLQPILCVGETLEERTLRQREAVLTRQLDILRGVEIIGTARLCIAYEPIWAIGTGHAATPEDVAQAHAFIADSVREHMGAAAEHLRILYGGSVDPTNIAAFLTVPRVDGVLVGTASQTAARLRNLVAAAGRE